MALSTHCFTCDAALHPNYLFLDLGRPLISPQQTAHVAQVLYHFTAVLQRHEGYSAFSILGKHHTTTHTQDLFNGSAYKLHSEHCHHNRSE